MRIVALFYILYRSLMRVNLVVIREAVVLMRLDTKMKRPVASQEWLGTLFPSA
jgi:hypothetical protein